MAFTTSPKQTPDWPGLVERIRLRDPAGMEQLYEVFSGGVRFLMCRQLGPQELDDRVHDVFLIVVQAIRRGDLREPERLMGFVRTVVRRQIATCIDKIVHARKEHADLQTGAAVWDAHSNPEADAIAQERTEIMKRVLEDLSTRDREILGRFYLLGQPAERICAEMALTENQFRLLKSRAKARFAQAGKKKLDHHASPKGDSRPKIGPRREYRQEAALKPEAVGGEK